MSQQQQSNNALALARTNTQLRDARAESKALHAWFESLRDQARRLREHLELVAEALPNVAAENQIPERLEDLQKTHDQMSDFLQMARKTLIAGKKAGAS